MALIERDALDFGNLHGAPVMNDMLVSLNDVAKTIKNAPVIDAVKVVRCGECRYKHEHRTKRNKQLVYECWRQDGNEFAVHPDDFCSQIFYYGFEDFGKTVFLTREEAEAKLKMEGKA